MTATELLAEVRHRGVDVHLADGRLRFSPRAAVTDLEPSIRAQARALADVLKMTVASDRPRAPSPRDAVQTRDSSMAPQLPLQVVVDNYVPAPSPVRVNAWTRVLDVERCVAHDLRELRAWVKWHAQVWGGEHHADDAAEAGEMIERLVACGCHVRVVPFHHRSGERQEDSR